MTIFDLQSSIIADYRDFVRSFLRIADPRVREFVNKILYEEGALWPDPLVQVSPSYKMGETVGGLVDEGLITKETADIFSPGGKPIRLYTHQEEAIRKALGRKSFVVTSGTGSGKTLCYFLPIIDSLIRQPDSGGRVAALVIYPMNALVNSQEAALVDLKTQYEKRTGKPFPVTFARYTGETQEQVRESMRRQPPQVLLTNYVMAELLLVRPEDQRFLDGEGGGLRFLVFDELHTYRGRQGADVAMLVRRLKERCAGSDLVHIGTSATMVAHRSASAEERRRVVAEFASRFFGTEFSSTQVIEETLAPVSEGGVPSRDELKGTLTEPVPGDMEAFRRFPLVRWVEYTLGLDAYADGELKRRQPCSLRKATELLEEEAGAPRELCEEKLREVLLRGAELERDDGGKMLAFKLHQFISQGHTVYATLQARERRKFSAQGQVQANRGQLLAPLKFCRQCGQDYYHVMLKDGRCLPHPVGAESEDEDALSGYLMLASSANDWSVDLIPDEWRQANGSVKPNWRKRVPEEVWVAPDGTCSEEAREGFQKMWWQEGGFFLCLNCGEFYTARERDFAKLATLSSEARSSATTVVALSLLNRAKQIGGAEPKLLTFTDNRQDAALQAGHFNDFIHTGLIRAALYKALASSGSLRADEVASAVVEKCGLEIADFARNPQLEPHSSAAQDAKRAFKDITEYRIYEDLRRGWRVIHPNLEQAGLLKIDYKGLDEVCDNDGLWGVWGQKAGFSANERREIVCAVLDHFRRKLAINAAVLKEQVQQQLRRRVEQHLNEFWGLDPDADELRQSRKFVLLGSSPRIEDDWIRLSAKGTVGRFVCSRLGLSPQEYDGFIGGFLNLLVRYGLLERLEPRDDHQLFQLNAACLVWQLGDGSPPPPDPIYTRRATGTGYAETLPRVNMFFQQLYKNGTSWLAWLEAREHTAQVVTPGERELRERRFRWSQENQNSHGVGRRLPYLICSPTLELGVDIADLEMVHLRNIPPTPANYSQRHGRAGRQGQPGIVVSYCGALNSHDQYFFRRPAEMVAGSVRAPQLDIVNEDLLRAHIHGIWLSHIRVPLGRSIETIIDTGQADLPLRENIAAQIRLSENIVEELCARIGKILRADEGLLRGTGWFSDSWIRKVVEDASCQFDRSFDRWRELYRIARRQLDTARIEEDRARSREEQGSARARQEEARRQLNLLLQVDVAREEGDFYPYRYLASEGFLPGYNFPALPVRAWIPRSDSEFISRPRMLAIREFAPLNLIYHEGARWEVVAFQFPPGGLEERKSRCRLCYHCGAFCQVDLDLCPVCHIRFDGSNSLVATVLEMPNVRTRRRERITSDEEERHRRGYRTEVFFQFPPSKAERLREADVRVGNTTVFSLSYAPAATLMVVNHGWRNAEYDGFLVNFDSGDIEREVRATSRRPQPRSGAGVRLAVRTTQNILLVKFQRQDLQDPVVEATLQYALQRGLEQTYQLEEEEIGAFRVGREGQRAILFYEASEGGNGVLRRLIEEPSAFDEVASQALARCHFDREGNDTKGECVAACYECLLSFSNQQESLNLDRRRIVGVLRELAQSKTLLRTGGKRWEDHLAWLRTLTDSRSELERRFLDALAQGHHRLPDDAQKRIVEVNTVPDFFYDPNVCIFCDGSVHDEPAQLSKDDALRKELRGRGYRVIVIRYDQDLRQQIGRFPEVFGLATE